MFDFQPDGIDEKKFKNNKIVDPIIFTLKDNVNIDLYFLLEYCPTSKTLNDLKNYIKSIQPNINYQIISALRFIPTEKDLSKEIINLYGNNSIDLSKYIPAWSKVITIGRGLYSITKGDDLSIEGFYDTIQWKTSFFSPNINSWIFPIPSFYSWLGKDTFENFFVKKQINIALKFSSNKIRIPKPNLIFEENPNEHLKKWKNYDDITAWDLETKTLDPWDPNGKIICLTCSYFSELNEYKAYYLPFEKIDYNLLNEWFKPKKLVGNNLKYDVKWVRVKHNISRENVQIYWDNMKGSHAINELQKNSLKSDAWLYTYFGGYDSELELYKLKYPACANDYSKIPQKILFPYATMDALVSLICYVKQQDIINELDSICKIDTGWSIMRSLREIAIPAINTFADIEISGMHYDWDNLSKIEDKFKIAINNQKEKIYKLLNIPDEINIDSGVQLGRFLKSRGWENPGLSKKGDYLTNEAAKQYWLEKGHKEVEDLLLYDQLHSCMKTYVGSQKENTGYWQYRKVDNKLHPLFKVMMADSWRGKCGNPNLQNVIKRSSIKIEDQYLHVLVRSCFSVPENFYLSENDASGLQLRIATSMALDSTMVDIFTKKGGDMHSITARSVFCPQVSLDEFLKNKKEKPYKDWRKKAKAINFGLLFGATARVFATNSLVPEWTFEEATNYVKDYNLEEIRRGLLKRLLKNYDKNKHGEYKNFIKDQEIFSYYWASAEDIRNKFFKTYSGLLDWHNKQKLFAKNNGYVSSPWGPIRRTPFLVYQGGDDDGARIKNYENISLNSPVQNFEACYIMYNLARVNNHLHKENKESYIVGNVHDSIIMYINKNELIEIKNIMTKYYHEEMPSLMNGIPYILEFGYSDYFKGEYWGITENEF